MLSGVALKLVGVAVFLGLGGGLFYAYHTKPIRHLEAVVASITTDLHKANTKLAICDGKLKAKSVEMEQTVNVPCIEVEVKKMPLKEKVKNAFSIGGKYITLPY